MVISCFPKAKFGLFVLEVKLMQHYSKVASQFGQLQKIHLTSSRKERQMHTTGMVDNVCNWLRSTKVLRT